MPLTATKLEWFKDDYGKSDIILKVNGEIIFNFSNQFFVAWMMNKYLSF